MPIRVLVVERHVLAREAMIAQLEKHPETDVVAAVAGDVPVEELLELIKEKQADVVILDFSVGALGGDAFNAVDAIRCPESGVRLLALVRRVDGILLRRLTSSRVMGCLFNDDPCVQSLAEMVRRVHSGMVTYSLEIYEQVFRHLEVRLTDRELDVLGLLGQGLSNKGIAERLSISPSTAQNHISNIYAKLDIRADAKLNRRMCAVNAARRSELIQNVHVMAVGEPPED